LLLPTSRRAPLCEMSDTRQGTELVRAERNPGAVTQWLSSCDALLFGHCCPSGGLAGRASRPLQTVKLGTRSSKKISVGDSQLLKSDLLLLHVIFQPVMTRPTAVDLAPISVYFASGNLVFG
jgi:hypothetical protein